MKKLLFLPLLLFAPIANGEPIVRIVGANGSSRAFATDNVHKLVLLSASVDVVNTEGTVLWSVPLNEITRVEFTDGTPNSDEAIETALISEGETVKIIEHNQVYILRNGKKYTIMGVVVENLMNE